MSSYGAGGQTWPPSTTRRTLMSDQSWLNFCRTLRTWVGGWGGHRAVWVGGWVGGEVIGLSGWMGEWGGHRAVWVGG